MRPKHQELSLRGTHAIEMSTYERILRFTHLILTVYLIRYNTQDSEKIFTF